MSSAVVPTCSRCGAELQPAPYATDVQCQYCGTVSQLMQPRRPAPIPAPPPAQVFPTPKRSHAWAYVWTGVILAGSLATSLIASRAAVAPGVGSKAHAAAPALQRGDGVPIQATDLRAVDPTALIQQAAAEVRKRASNCELTYAYIGVLKGGVLDATGHESLLRWGCRSVDSSKPPGQDVADDEFDVRVSEGTLDIKKAGLASHNKPPWVEPTCPFSQGFAAAVASGLPANSSVSVYYRYSSQSALMAWDLTVSGHPELSRKVDGATCQVVR